MIAIRNKASVVIFTMLNVNHLSVKNSSSSKSIIANKYQNQFIDHNAGTAVF